MQRPAAIHGAPLFQPNTPAHPRVDMFLSFCLSTPARILAPLFHISMTHSSALCTDCPALAPPAACKQPLVHGVSFQRGIRRVPSANITGWRPLLHRRRRPGASRARLAGLRMILQALLLQRSNSFEVLPSFLIFSALADGASSCITGQDRLPRKSAPACTALMLLPVGQSSCCTGLFSRPAFADA